MKLKNDNWLGWFYFGTRWVKGGTKRITFGWCQSPDPRDGFYVSFGNMSGGWVVVERP
jgi:hypothetical protein